MQFSRMPYTQGRAYITMTHCLEITQNYLNHGVSDVIFPQTTVLTQLSLDLDPITRFTYIYL